MMATYLDRIMAQTLLRVLDRKATAKMESLERRAMAHVPRGFTAGLRRVAVEGPAIIAELKKASPSKGLLREDYRPAVIARTYEEVGAAAISVLTDEEFFQGSLEDLAMVSQAVRIPVLRKDFILDPFQILEARAAGADAVLLIVAAHANKDLVELSAEARRQRLDVLCEVHDREELARALDLGFELIGVNSRDLKTLQVDSRRHFELISSMPEEVLRVAESGIRTPADVEQLMSVGYDAFLVGETLMRQPEPSAALALLLGRDYASDV